MRLMMIAVLAAALLIGTASSAMAEFFALQADVPLQMDYSASDLTADSVSGYIVGLSTPFFVGIALEDYETTGTVDVGGSDLDFTQSTQFTDIFIDFPFPVVNLGLGYGVGTAAFELDDNVGVKFDDAVLTQVFATVGIPFALLFDVHVGYRQISGTADVKSGGSGEADLDGNLLSLGVKIGF